MGRKSKPYATMKDGPDKYLFRKDGKQKLVGSADNEPDEGEVELEEAPGDFYNVDGYIYRQHEIEDEEGFYKRWHYMVTPDNEEIYIDYTPYQDMDKDEFIDFVEKFKRSSLKENDMTDELNEMRKAAGLPIVEDEAIEEVSEDEAEEAVEEGKLPDALKKHQFGAKDDGSDDKDDDDSDDKDDDDSDDKEEVDEDVANWMKRFDNLDGIVNEDCDESEEAEKNDDGECSPFTHADENVEMVREEQCSECCGGKDCKKCAAAALKENDVDEDFLAPPSDIEGGSYEDVDVNRDETNIQAFDRDMSDSEPFNDDYPIDEAQYTRKDFRMVADTLLKIEDPMIRQSQAEEYAAKFSASNPLFNRDLFMAAAGIVDEDANTHVGREFASSEFGGEGGNTHVGREFASSEMVEQGPGDDEFAHDDDAMVDVGDEDYDSGEDFSDLANGDYYGDNQYYEAIEMNELRKAAGLPILEADDTFMGLKPTSIWWENDPADLMSYIYWQKNQVPPSSKSAYAKNWNNIVKQLSAKHPPPSDWVNPVETPEPTEQECRDCLGTGRAPGYDGEMGEDPCYKCDGSGKIVETMDESTGESDDYTYFDFPDEQAYYLVADEVGDRIIFGMNNEVGVPEQFVDGIISLLSKHGFEKGQSYSVAGMEEDLQNGYNDRAFTDGQDYFPKGSHQSPANDLGPTAGRQGDNPMRSPMASTERDEVYEGMKQAYRRHRRS